MILGVDIDHFGGPWFRTLHVKALNYEKKEIGGPIHSTWIWRNQQRASATLKFCIILRKAAKNTFKTNVVGGDAQPVG